MKFNNVPNPFHYVEGKIVWESRSIAVTGVIFIYKNLIPHVLVSRRGPKSADYKDKMNLVAGYLDWNETGFEAFVRETWEETGFNLLEALETMDIIKSNTKEPWSVNSKVDENHQNVTLRYGVCFQIGSDEQFPLLTTEHNEVVGECEDPQWLPLEHVNEHEWAFNHDKVIEEYYNKINDIP